MGRGETECESGATDSQSVPCPVSHTRLETIPEVGISGSRVFWSFFSLRFRIRLLFEGIGLHEPQIPILQEPEIPIFWNQYISPRLLI